MHDLLTIDLDAALASGKFQVMLGAALWLGFLHTVLGPDHYVPFAMMAKAHQWSRKKVLWVTFLCGLGHCASSVVIAVIVAIPGAAAVGWNYEEFQEHRGPIAAWALMGLGLAFTTWGVVRALRGKQHSHVHIHGGQEPHVHVHDHAAPDHMHVHNEAHVHGPDQKVRKLTPWVLFTVFVFGPCESLIPLMLVALPLAGWGGASLIAVSFSGVTCLTIMVLVGLLLLGMRRIPFPWLDRWATTLAGVSLIACGAAIQWLGL
ncbi:MAG: hypothetical protein L6Q71_08310 [Planctomycetes bacterium]|nr:hypothetical protein [Planctomycetota bacterium]NUQ34492.1 hypothetical protein [Planctomycetaceae bacterium]